MNPCWKVFWPLFATPAVIGRTGTGEGKRDGSVYPELDIVHE